MTGTIVNTGTLRGYRSTGDITFDLDGTVSTDIGWVIFEVSDGSSEGHGVIGTFNNYATLKLVRFERAQKPCRIHGDFGDGHTEAQKWLLDDVVLTDVLSDDVTGFIGFRAGVATSID